MPQMAPLWWETLFILFIVKFLLMNTIMYFNKPYTPKSSSMQKSMSSNEFKWEW
uniref:ATP synthase complex subunit 8 n=1 Tax=Notopteryx soror TaxID=2021948 RepID=A0A343ISI1_9HEMI|nr:ATP synthase F0 subunit 8 [Notopteryx soror]AST10206.1 ATP synthase F0 subunit 8 [Notopteryx soror]